MSLTTRVLTTAGAAALAVATLSSPAFAVDTVCRQVTVGLQNVASVCVTARLNGTGTTVAPYVWAGCTIGTNLACAIKPVNIGTTGFVPNLSYPAPSVDPATGSVRLSAGTVGTLYVDGIAVPVDVPEICVGDPSFC
jgi:hypothetical protein